MLIKIKNILPSLTKHTHTNKLLQRVGRFWLSNYNLALQNQTNAIASSIW